MTPKIQGCLRCQYIKEIQFLIAPLKTQWKKPLEKIGALSDRIAISLSAQSHRVSFICNEFRQAFF